MPLIARAIFVDALLSEKRDRPAAEAFSRSARTVSERVPERVTTDEQDSYPGAIKAELEEAVQHRTTRYLNNYLEQDHTRNQATYVSNGWIQKGQAE